MRQLVIKVLNIIDAWCDHEEIMMMMMWSWYLETNTGNYTYKQDGQNQQVQTQIHKLNALQTAQAATYEGCNFNSGNYLFTTDTK